MTIGHNSSLANMYAHLTARYEELLESLERMPMRCNSAEDERKFLDFNKQLGTLLKDLEDGRKAEKQIHLDNGRQVDSFFNQMKGPIEEGKKKAQQVLGAYMAQEGITKATSNRGATASLVRKWQWSVVNLGSVPREWMVLDTEKIDELCKGEDPPDIPGLKFELIHIGRVR